MAVPEPTERAPIGLPAPRRAAEEPRRTRSRVHRVRLERLEAELQVLERSRWHAPRVRWMRVPPERPRPAHANPWPAWLGVIAHSAALLGSLLLWRSSGDLVLLGVAAYAAGAAVLLLRYV